MTLAHGLLVLRERSGWEWVMQRRHFLRSAAAAAASALPLPAVWPARAQSRQETLLVVTEYGPNSFDIHGVGTNRPGYEVSWNYARKLMRATPRPGIGLRDLLPGRI